MAERYELVHEIRGKGLMIGIQFGKPASLSLKTGWPYLMKTGLHKMNEDLFCQMITMPLLEKHHILTQVAGHGLDTVKILPPLVINQADADYFLGALDDVLKDAHINSPDPHGRRSKTWGFERPEPHEPSPQKTELLAERTLAHGSCPSRRYYCFRDCAGIDFSTRFRFFSTPEQQSGLFGLTLRSLSKNISGPP